MCKKMCKNYENYEIWCPLTPWFEVKINNVIEVIETTS